MISSTRKQIFYKLSALLSNQLPFALCSSLLCPYTKSISTTLFFIVILMAFSCVLLESK